MGSGRLLFCGGRRLAASARHSGVVAFRRHLFLRSFFLISANFWRLQPDIRAWSPPGEGQGVRGGTPLHPLRPPYSPCPCGGGRHCRMSCTLSVARRRGQVGAHLPALRAICAPAAALPLRGDRLRAPARWADGIFGGFRVERRGATSPFRYAAKRWVAGMFLPLVVCCCPAVRRGRLPAASFFAFFLSNFRQFLAASARHPGVVACAAGGRG